MGRVANGYQDRSCEAWEIDIIIPSLGVLYRTVELLTLPTSGGPLGTRFVAHSVRDTSVGTCSCLNTGSQPLAQANPQFSILQLQPSGCWDYRHAPPHFSYQDDYGDSKVPSVSLLTFIHPFLPPNSSKTGERQASLGSPTQKGSSQRQLRGSPVARDAASAAHRACESTATSHQLLAATHRCVTLFPATSHWSRFCRKPRAAQKGGAAGLPGQEESDRSMNLKNLYQSLSKNQESNIGVKT